MTTIVDQFLMFAGVVVLAYICHRVWIRFFPGRSAEECGYAPGSEAISVSAIVGAIAVVGVLVFGVAHLGAAAGF